MTSATMREWWALSRQQWMERSRLEERRDARLRELVEHAHATVPYYRRLFKSRGLSPRDIATADDLPKLPVLTRAMLRDAPPGDFLSESVDRGGCLAHRTSGSTGQVLTLYRTRREKTCSDVTYLRSRVANGMRPWHRQAFILFADETRMRGPMPWLDRLWGSRKLLLPLGGSPGEHVAALRAFRPHVLVGNSRNLTLLARAMQRSGGPPMRLRLVAGGAEMLDDGSRALIDEAFQVRMIDEYASAEAGCIGWECPAHCGYHLSVDTVIVEFLRSGQPASRGQPGHVVVTPLFRRAMPLLRYDQGDIGTALDGRCSCGRTLPRMQLVDGRVDSFVTLRSGIVISPLAIRLGLHREPEIEEYRVVQDDIREIAVHLVLRPGATRDVAERVQRHVEDLIRREATVRVELTDRLAGNPLPKSRPFVSRVPLPF